MNIAILSGHPNNPYARDILRALNGRGLSQINVVAASGGTDSRSAKALWTTYGWSLPTVFVRWLGRRFTKWMMHRFKSQQPASDTLEAEVYAQGGRFVQVQKINGEECCRVLDALQVDLMILGGVPIVRESVLKMPRFGTINAHQGELPRFRGMNVIEWALLHNCPPTISIHFVDPGIDTGDVITMEAIPIAEGDTLNTVRTRANCLQSELLARTALAAQAGQISSHFQRQKDGKQYYLMHPLLRAAAERRLQHYNREAPARA